MAHFACSTVLFLDSFVNARNQANLAELFRHPLYKMIFTQFFPSAA